MRKWFVEYYEFRGFMFFRLNFIKNVWIGCFFCSGELNKLGVGVIDEVEEMVWGWFVGIDFVEFVG